MKNRKKHFEMLVICIAFFLVYCCNGYSQVFHFEIKFSKKEIDNQKEVFKNAKVKSAVIGTNDGEKITFDKEGRMLTREAFSTEEDLEFFSSKYVYNETGQLTQINTESGDFEVNNLEYDDNGNVKKFTYMYRPTEIYQYDVNNNVSQIDFESTTLSVCPSIVLKYDDNNKVIEKNKPCCDGQVFKSLYSYYADGNIYEITDNYSDCKSKSKSISKTIYTYNSLNLPIRVEYIDSDNSTRIQNITYKYYK